MISAEQEIENFVAQAPLRGEIRCLPLPSEPQLIFLFRRLMREQVESQVEACGELSPDDIRDRLRMAAPALSYHGLSLFDRVMSGVATAGPAGHSERSGTRLRRVIENEMQEAIRSKTEQICRDPQADRRSRNSLKMPMAAALAEGPRNAEKSRDTVRRSIGSEQAAAAVHAYILRRGWNMTTFAAQCNISPRTVSRFLKTQKIRRSVFEDIAKQVGATVEQLLSGEVPSKIKP